MASFAREYKRLNAAQAEAVDHIDGPVLVIAGPGTGKTQLLSLRVANILRRTDTAPDNILCLTFTNKAANNMRERLSALIGTEGNRVPVRTFHSFAGELMTLYPDYFWNGARLTHVPEAVQLELVTDILSELPLTHPLALKFAGAFTGVKDVLAGLRLSKEAGLTPDKLRALIEHNQTYIDLVEPELVDICAARLSYKQLDSMAERVAALPAQAIDELTRPLIALSTVITESFAAAYAQDSGTNKTAALGKWKSRWIRTIDGQKGMFDERARNAWWLALCEVYQMYRDRLHQRGYYDYADMIIEVISQLEQHPELLAAAQERFQYVLIDEFQDTNAAQLRLAHLVANHYANADKPNIMAVGDDDQAIYKFNGAELGNMLGFRRSYPAAKLIVLTDNYRSTQAVLDSSQQIIVQASERVVSIETSVQKTLTARGSPAQTGIIEHLSYPTAPHQYHGLAKKIAGLYQKEQGTIAVLARSHDSLRMMAGLLQQQGTPIRYEQQRNILDHEVIQQIVTLARVVNALATGEEAVANQHIAQLLSHTVWAVRPETLWQLAVQNRRQPAWIKSLLNHPDPALQNLAHWLLWLSRESVGQPLPRMLEYIIGLQASDHLTSPLREYFLRATETTDASYLAGLSGVHKLVELAQEFCRHGQATLGDFVRLVQVSQENSQTITDESPFISAPHAVELLTVHKAKGLEFGHVFVIDAMDSIWRPKPSGRKPPANLPLKPNGDELDDYIRLMFVAVTRAKHSVSIGSYYLNSSGEAALPSGIIRDIFPPKRIGLTAALPTEVLEATLRWPRLESGDEKLLLQAILEDFSLSATALLNFLDISKGGPAYFLERHLLRLPEATTPKAAFGNAMHQALEFAQQLARQKGFDLQQTLMRYETSLREQYLSPADHERYLLHGQNVLRQLFETYRLQLLPAGRPEVKLAGLRIDSARIGGALDRIDTHGKTTLITDYKTGTPLHSFLTHDKTKQLKAWRHRTQLQFYTLLAATSGQFKGQALSAQMMYLEAESPKDLYRSHIATADELERLRQLIIIVWQKIVSLNLPDVRHYEQNYAGIKRFEEDLLQGKI